MRKNSYIRGLTESQTLGYVLRSISEGKNEEQIAERFEGNTALVKTWIDALKQIHYVVTNQFNELVITLYGKNYLQKFDSDR
ncbi:MAG TPA: hypothetical protein VE548_06820 [Nitrososphaeraceae archaeon]|jgi:hypothetical protein|nr:hypothetical protein [Nitrososphaeraceae archaeon]